MTDLITRPDGSVTWRHRHHAECKPDCKDQARTFFAFDRVTDDLLQALTVDPRVLDRHGNDVLRRTFDRAFGFMNLWPITLAEKIAIGEVTLDADDGHGEQLAPAQRTFDLTVPLDRVIWPATPKQATYIRSLAGQRQWDAVSAPLRELIQAIVSGELDKTATYEKTVPVPGERRVETVEVTDTGLAIAKVDASRVIDALLSCPPVYTAPAPSAAPAADGGVDLSSVPAGIYGVPGFDTRLKVRIDKPTKGKWAGWTFVKDGAEYGHEQRYGSVRPGDTYRGMIMDQLRAIAASPAEAAAKYGHLTGHCSICGRKLEDEESVKAGIGPVCRAKVGW